MKSPWDDLVPPTRWPQLTLRQYIAIAVIAIGLMSVVNLAWGRGVQVNCRELAQLASSVSWAREMGAKEDRVVADLRKRNSIAGQAYGEAIAREMRRVWRTGLPIEEAGQYAYDRCTARLGDIGREG
jgi:hypothetical protein